MKILLELIRAKEMTQIRLKESYNTNRPGAINQDSDQKNEKKPEPNPNRRATPPRTLLHSTKLETKPEPGAAPQETPNPKIEKPQKPEPNPNRGASPPDPPTPELSPKHTDTLLYTY